LVEVISSLPPICSSNFSFIWVGILFGLPPFDHSQCVVCNYHKSNKNFKLYINCKKKIIFLAYSLWSFSLCFVFDYHKSKKISKSYIICKNKSFVEQEDLAKFGYTLNIKVIFFKSHSFFLAMVFELYTENWRFFLNCRLNLAIQNDVEQDLAKFGYTLNIKGKFFKCLFLGYVTWIIYRKLEMFS
jgi:hypothetical protein